MIKKTKTIASFAIGTASGTQGIVIPSDVDSVIVKAYGTLTGTSPTQDIVLQTTDDGGTTFYDVGRFAQITGSVTNANALWITLNAGPHAGAYVGASAAAGLSVGTVSSLPLLNRYLYVVNTAGGTVGTCTITLTVYGTQSGGF